MLKKWEPDSWTSIITASRRSREALAWKAGLLDSRRLGTGLEAPVVHAQETASGAWIVMRDVPEVFPTFAARGRDPAVFRAVLDRVASFHATSLRRRLPPFTSRWLFPSKSRIGLLSETHAAWVGTPGRVYHDIWARMRGKHPDLHDSARDAFYRFTDLIPSRDRPRWMRHLRDRAQLRRRLSGAATCFLHGDMNERNFGLAGTDQDFRLVAVDWEWAGVGSPALDLASLVYHMFLNPFRQPPDDYAQSLRLVEEFQDHYYERLVHHGGAVSRPEWDRVWPASLLACHLSLLPCQGGWAVGGGLSPHRILAQIEHATDLMRRVLPV